MSQALKQATQKDVDTAFGKFTRARICLNHTNRVQQWTKQINHIEDRALKVRLSHIERAQSQHLDREAAVRRRLCDSVNRLRAIQEVFRQHTMENISNVVRGGDFEVAVSKFVEGEVSKKLSTRNLDQKRQGRLRNRYERSRADFNMLLGRLTSMDLTIKSPDLRRRREAPSSGEKSARNRRKLDNFSLPYLMLNPMLTTDSFVEQIDPAALEDLTEEELAALEERQQDRFKEVLDAAYDIDVRQPSPSKAQHSRATVKKRESGPATVR